MRGCWLTWRARFSTAPRSTGTPRSRAPTSRERPLVARLRLVAGVAGVHRGTPLPSSEQNAAGLSVATTASTTRPRPPERWGHLRVLERIGGGAFGEVYRAWDTRLDREVALKLLPVRSGTGDARATSIIEEGRLLARVDHPNVVTIFGADRIDGRVGLWMELVRGRTLQEVVEQGHGFSVAEVVDIGMQLCRRGGRGAPAGLIHRDIKAHNVMRADDGRIKLMDFGAGREMGGRVVAARGHAAVSGARAAGRTRAHGPQRRLQPRRAPVPSLHGVVSRAGARSAGSAARARAARTERRPRGATGPFASTGAHHRPGHRPRAGRPARERACARPRPRGAHEAPAIRRRGYVR